MLRVLFIGKTNQTNEIISEILRSAFDADIEFEDPTKAFGEKGITIAPPTNLAIIDLNTSHGFGNAPDNIKIIKKNSPNIPVLVLDHHDDKKFIHPLVEAGASGVISHTPTELILTEAVTELLGGNTFYDYPD
ncbi:hypothetical protein [Gracilimonas sp.]|uniref:hypothetical protein n=1 Tax=Gracilimonas sp. TaxID=1974203 RepID=UPI0032EB87A0